jgi:hypothetical protein
MAILDLAEPTQYGPRGFGGRRIGRDLAGSAAWVGYRVGYIECMMLRSIV